MRITKTMSTRFLALICALLSAWSVAQGTFVEGQHYTRLAEPVRTDNPKKIEVVEIFQYSCPACFAFEPLSTEWKQQQAADVDYKRLHAQFNSQSPLLARAMFTAIALRKIDTLHPALFQAFHLGGNKLGNQEAIKKVFTANGVDAERFDKTWDSFGVDSLVKRAEDKVRLLKITSTPQLAIDGTFIISINQDVRDQASMLQIATFLVNKIRAEKGLE